MGNDDWFRDVIAHRAAEPNHRRIFPSRKIGTHRPAAEFHLQHDRLGEFEFVKDLELFHLANIRPPGGALYAATKSGAYALWNIGYSLANIEFVIELGVAEFALIVSVEVEVKSVRFVVQDAILQVWFIALFRNVCLGRAGELRRPVDEVSTFLDRGQTWVTATRPLVTG